MSGSGAGPLIVAIFGPTGTGKTALACGIADLLPCHLISCDAVQVYRDLSAAAVKPRGEDARHSWALVDVAEPTRDFNLGEWVRRAEREIAWAAGAGRIPVVAGGTGLYLRGLVKGVTAAPARVEALRRRLWDLSARRGAPFLHRVLTRLDPATAGRLSANDRQRLVRALEVRLSTGGSLARLHEDRWSGPDRFETFRVGLTIPRDELNPRLDRRVQGFFDRGLVAETRWLLETRGAPVDANALRGIGYREVAHWLAQPDGVSEDELVACVQRSTRRYAKRQMTWFRREAPTLWLDPRETGVAARLAAEIERRRLQTGIGL